MNDPIDVAIVGGGAAGIAAARRLTWLGRRVLLLEALPRLGGRACTVVRDGVPLDLGCGWLHSAKRNPLAELAVRQEQRLDRSASVWHRQLRDIRFPPQDQHDAWGTFRELGERLRASPPPGDRVGEALPREHRWRPFIDAVSSFVNGTEIDQLSAADYLAYEDAATEDNWRLPAGYGAFIAAQAADLPVALDTCVESLRCGDHVTLQSARGTLRARAAIVAVSSAVLAKGSLRFDPTVEQHLHAASRLPLGLADKVYLSLGDVSAVPPDSHLLGRLDRAATGSYYLRPFGRAVVECFLGGSWARELQAAGEAAAVAFAIDELRLLLGQDFAKTLAPMAASHWGREPTIRGSYSHALPGHAAARAVLARPVSERLCFAGEACSATDFSTAHGAWQSGIVAADWIERFLSGAA